LTLSNFQSKTGGSQGKERKKVKIMFEKNLIMKKGRIAGLEDLYYQIALGFYYIWLLINSVHIFQNNTNSTLIVHSRA
jgi:hypothetical protein